MLLQPGTISCLEKTPLANRKVKKKTIDDLKREVRSKFLVSLLLYMNIYLYILHHIDETNL